MPPIKAATTEQSHPRNRRSGSRVLWLIVTAIFFLALSGFPRLFCFPSAFAEQQAPAPITVTFQNPYGSVIFDHNVHRRHGCSECHPPFDFKHELNTGYSLRAHGLCVSCHEKSSRTTQCTSCHAVHQRTKKPLDPSVMKSSSAQRQDILDFFFKRRSIRKFQDRRVPDEIIRDLLKAAMAAPSAGNWQPWEFIVIRDERLKTTLAGTSPFAKFIKDAPVVIGVTGKRNNHWAPFDCALAAGNILLAAANLELGGTYCGYDDEREGKAREVLGIPDDYYLYSLIPIGYPAESKKPYTKYNEDRIHWDRFKVGRPEVVVTE